MSPTSDLRQSVTRLPLQSLSHWIHGKSGSGCRTRVRAIEQTALSRRERVRQLAHHCVCSQLAMHQYAWFLFVR